jgi:HD domain
VTEPRLDTATFREVARSLGRSSVAGLLGLSVDPRDLAKLSVPDTAAAREAEDLCREASSESLANHCFRSFAWGVFLGVADGYTYDGEALYVASMLHDLGLTPAFDRGGCFEDDGATAAREVLHRLGWDGARVDLVADAIRLHMHDITPGDSSEAHLLTFGTSADVSGRRALEIDARLRKAILAVYPRLGFKRHFSALFLDQATRKPSCVVHRYVHERGLLELIANAPYDE